MWYNGRISDIISKRYSGDNKVKLIGDSHENKKKDIKNYILIQNETIITIYIL